MIINNFSLTGTETIDGYTVGLLTSEDGQDWYESQEQFDPGKLKFEFDSEGVITRLSMDISELWPVDRSVAEIALDEVPEGINEKGEWRFDGNNIVPVPVDYAAMAANTKSTLLTLANEQITILLDRIELGRSRAGDDELLKKWKIFRLDVSDIDADNADKAVTFPEPPVK